MKKRMIALMVGIMCTSAFTPVAGAFLGNIISKVPVVGKKPAVNTKIDTPAVVKTPGLSQHPTKIAVTLNSPEAFDFQSKYVIRGKVFYAGTNKPPPEYTRILLAPKNAYLQGNVFTGGYYGEAYTNTSGEFSLGAKPSNYVILIFTGSYACVAHATPAVSGAVKTYALTDTGSRIMFKQ